MPRTVDDGFRTFLAQLTPSEVETEAAKAHRASIEACLKANFNLIRFFRTGSFGNGTSIRGFSDVDYFASIPTSTSIQNSEHSLIQVRDALAARFPNTGVRVNCPAVRVPFGTNAKENTEVVPANLAGITIENHLIYDIPNCSGMWMRSSPDAHNAYVRDIDQKLGGKAKALVRFMKAWKYYCQVPISSFYLEMFVANYAQRQATIVYDIDVKFIFDWLAHYNLAMIPDPKGIAGYIRPCSTDAQLEEARSKLKTAVLYADKAREALTTGNTTLAFAYWNLLYNGKFPKYEP